MTREEALNKIGELVVYARTQEWDDEFTKAFEVLEQEPCEDAISRQAIKMLLGNRFMELQKRHDDKRYETNYCLNTILELPPVTPKQRTGHWMETIDIEFYKCSECGCHWEKGMVENCNMDYCPNCGVKMESEVSSADSD